MENIQPPITTISGIGLRMGAMILAKVGDFSRFDSPDKILAYVGLSLSTYQSGQLSMNGAYSHMVQCGHFPCRQKLVRLIYAMERSGQTFRTAA